MLHRLAHLTAGLFGTFIMQQAFLTMLTMQDRMNRRIHPEWIAQHYEWYRALWIECGELIEHYGYKWWKKQTPDIEQVRLEAIDIWHFGMSALFVDNKTPEVIAAEMAQAVAQHQPSGLGVREATEALAAYSLNTKSFSVALFWDLMIAVELSFDELYRQYVGKNVLNFFRQDHGYKEGTYIKSWNGREDNEHLVEILAALDSSASNYADQVYAALATRYRAVIDNQAAGAMA
jgi:dimeric dUTPase (all-alpha-NTP-PPase superfamily)